MTDQPAISIELSQLRHLLGLCESLDQSSKAKIIRKLARVSEALAIKSQQSLTMIERRSSTCLNQTRKQKIEDTAKEVIGRVLDLGSSHMRKFVGISTSIRRQAKTDFNWNSLLGKDMDKIKLGHLNQINYFANNGLTLQLQISYTCPEIGDRLLFGGESQLNNKLMVFTEDLSNLDCIIDFADAKDVYAFTYINGYEVYITNQGDLVVNGEDLIRPLTLKVTPVKYYYNARPNMNRGLVTDKKNLFILGIDKNSRNCVYSLRITDFKNGNALIGAIPQMIEATAYIEDLSFNDTYLFGLYPNGHLVRVDKKNYDSFVRTKKFDNVDVLNMCNGPEKWKKFREYFTTIAANNMVVVTASDNLHDKTNSLYIRDPKTLRLLDECTFERSVDYSLVCPIHQLKIVTIKDLCLVAALSRMRNVFFFMLRGRKIHKLKCQINHNNYYAIWGILFNKKTNELIIHGNGGFLSKTEIKLDGSGQYEKNSEIEDPDHPKAQATFVLPKATCSEVKNFNAAIEHLTALKIRKGTVGQETKKQKKSNLALKKK